MGIVQKDALRTTVVSYMGLVLGYVNKVFLFILLLSTAEIGLLNLLLSTGVLFAQFANLGTINATWKFFPFLRNDTNKHYGFLTLNILIVLSGTLFFSLLIILFKDVIGTFFEDKSSAFVEYYYWIIPTGIGLVLFKLLDSYLRALYKNVFPVIANELLFRVLTTILLILYAYNVFTFEQLVIAVCLSQFFPGLLLIGYLMKIGEWHFSVKEIAIPKKFKKIIVSYSLYTYVNSLGAVLIVSLDAIMITSMLGLAENGVYSTMVYFIRVLMIPYASISRVSAPLISQHWKDRDMDKMNDLYMKVSSVTLVIGLFFFLGVWVNRVELFQFLPPEFESGIYIFLFLMIGRLLDTYFGLNGIILLTSKKYRYDIVFTSVLIVLVVVLNLYLIPIWGVYGAAISTSIAYFIYNFSRLVFVWYHYKIHPFSYRQFLIMALFGVVLFFFEITPLEIENIWLSLLLKSAIVCALFPAVIYFFKIELEIVDYVNKVLATARGKLKRK